MDSDRQLKLFTDGELEGQATLGNRRSHLHQMTRNSLQEWKAQIFRHQQQARASVPLEQIALFDIAPAHCDPAVEPFSLSLQSMAFYRMPTDNCSQAAIYFVIDNAAHVVLYIGETCRSSKRWKGQHDCKTYLENYQSLHHQHGLSCAVNIAFWWAAPVHTRPRQQLEQALIQKWRSPFNKENWSVWSTPFV